MSSTRRWFYVCLMGMVHGKDIENDMQGVDEQWTELVDLDRGGLWHVTEQSINFSCCWVRSQGGFKEIFKAFTTIKVWDGVEHYQWWWCAVLLAYSHSRFWDLNWWLTISWNTFKGNSGTLLYCFSLASLWLEYKQCTKKTTWHNKSLNRARVFMITLHQ